MGYHFAGWSPGTTIEQSLVLVSTILHRLLSSNMAAVGGQFTEFYGLFSFVQWVYRSCRAQWKPDTKIDYAGTKMALNPDHL